MRKIKSATIDLGPLRAICLIMVGIELNMNWIYFTLVMISIFTIKFERK